MGTLRPEAGGALLIHQIHLSISCGCFPAHKLWGATNDTAAVELLAASARVKHLEAELAQARAGQAAATQRLHSLMDCLREGLLLLDEDLCVSLINN